ncbi:DUF2235 domain-containing protein [Xanthobacter sp. 126]|uniref:T6SS phospholipase effector Tle1-like catalytic domain-containing protein n=1 Tax=Xanthobacter sp. 126 TaxID=1131814 RepID=UPI00045E94F6|nr:DUF2235 domain-containing protein [Xanthobacter sp. 126]
MGKNIVLLLDGTSNQISQDRTNILRLFLTMKKDESQLVYYDPGVGTFGGDGSWFRTASKVGEVWGLATGMGLDRNVKEAYQFLVQNYSSGQLSEDGERGERDRIMIFGFSRGAYTARVLAGFIHAVGIMKVHNLNLLDYAYRAYKGVDERDDHEADSFKEVRLFERTLDTDRPPIRLLGLFDTVASVFESGRWGPRLKSHAFTRRNKSVESVLHAVAIDERRTMFQPQLWEPGQEFWGNPFNRDAAKPQDLKEVWFVGGHGDVGGGYPEEQSALAKVPLAWMIREAGKRDVLFRPQNVNAIAHGTGSKGDQIAPDPLADDHVTLTLAWKPVEIIPRRKPPLSKRPSVLGISIPFGERRAIPEGALLHGSVVLRKQAKGYWPANLPTDFGVED